MRLVFKPALFFPSVIQLSWKICLCGIKKTPLQCLTFIIQTYTGAGGLLTVVWVTDEWRRHHCTSQGHVETNNQWPSHTHLHSLQFTSHACFGLWEEATEPGQNPRWHTEEMQSPCWNPANAAVTCGAAVKTQGQPPCRVNFPCLYKMIFTPLDEWTRWQHRQLTP